MRAEGSGIAFGGRPAVRRWAGSPQRNGVVSIAALRLPVCISIGVLVMGDGVAKLARPDVQKPSGSGTTDMRSRQSPGVGCACTAA